MEEDKEAERADSTEITRQGVLRSGFGGAGSECGTCGQTTQRRTFLGGVVTSALGLIGLSSPASASPDAEDVAETLEERREFIEVLVENDVLSDQILRDLRKSSARSLAKSSSIAAGKDENTGYVTITFPEESDEVRLAFGDELTDVRIAFPDDVDGEAITQEMNKEVSGFVEPDASASCCDDNGYCALYDDVAESRCTYTQIGAGTCGSYTCGTTSCEDEDGNGILDWCCDCCGGGHSWCGGTPVCYSSIWC